MGLCPLAASACTLVHSTVSMTSVTVQPRLRSLTGFEKPCMSGPIAPPPDDCCTACHRMTLGLLECIA